MESRKWCVCSSLARGPDAVVSRTESLALLSANVTVGFVTTWYEMQVVMMMMIAVVGFKWARSNYCLSFDASDSTHFHWWRYDLRPFLPHPTPVRNRPLPYRGNIILICCILDVSLMNLVPCSDWLSIQAFRLSASRHWFHTHSRYNYINIPCGIQ